MIRAYLMTWVWALVLAPVVYVLTLAGLPVMVSAAIVVAVLVLAVSRKRKRPVVTAPPPRQLTRREVYSEYISSAAWREKRRQRLAIDRHQCQDCGGSWDLEVHHTDYTRFGHEDMSDLVTLCDKCHHSRHARQRAAHH
jgi:5-methylcytosine-specific restriction endonuclease McrA